MIITSSTNVFKTTVLKAISSTCRSSSVLTSHSHTQSRPPLTSWSTNAATILHLLLLNVQAKEQQPEYQIMQTERSTSLIEMMSDSINYAGLGEVIRPNAFCKCTDPKDRIYGILSLLSERDIGINIQPDYTKTATQIYRDCLF